MTDSKLAISSQNIGKKLGISGIHVITDKREGLLRRTIWVLLLLFMSGVMLWQVEKRLQLYFSNPIAVNVQVKHEKSVRFPVILICNLNHATLSGSYGFMESSVITEGWRDNNFYQFWKDYISLDYRIRLLNGKSYLLNSTLKKFTDDHPWVAFSLGNMEEDINYDYEKQLDLVTKVISHRIGKMLKSCFWQNMPCSEENFTLVFNPEHLSYCFAFNSDTDNPLYTKESGPDGALKLIMDVQQYEYVHSNHGGAGLKVIIMDELIKDEPGRFPGDGILVQAGSIASIALSRNNYSEVKPPIGTCNETHSISQCIDECTSRFVIDQCGCRTDWMKGNARYCDFYERLACANTKLDTFLSSPASDSYCNCAPKCKRTEYQRSVTSAIWAEYDITSKLLTHQPPNDLHKIGRLQDWTYLDQTDRNLTRKLFTIGRQIFHVQKDILIPVSSRLMFYSDMLSDIIHSQGDYNSNIKDLLFNTLHLVLNMSYSHKLLFKNITKFFSYESLHRNVKNTTNYTTSDIIPEDFFVRSANDILRHNGKHMMEFHSNITEIFQKNKRIIKLLRNKAEIISEDFESKLKGNITLILEQLAREELSQEYEIVEDVFSSVYAEFTDVLTKVHKNPDLLGTRDWGKVTNEEFYKLNYVGLDIYYESLSTTRTSQFETDSLTSLICDLGGNIGLWLGGSILTLFEILDLTFIVLNPSRFIGNLGVFKGKSPIKLSSSKRRITNCTVIDIEEKGV